MNNCCRGVGYEVPSWLAFCFRLPSNKAKVKQLLVPIFLLAAAHCQAAPILPEEAKRHVGENVSVRGMVQQVSVSKKGHAFLNFGGNFPNQIFTGFVPAAECRQSWRRRVSAVAGEQPDYLNRQD